MDSPYKISDIKKTYNRVEDLLLSNYIIKQFSTNKKDIRTSAVEVLDLSRAKNILDLGCGYGFFIEALKNRLSPDAQITGIDIVKNNSEAFINSVEATGYSGRFICSGADAILKMPACGFDAVISCFSLYFFPRLISHIHRILKPDGIFIAVTHSIHSLEEAIELEKKCMKKLSFTVPDKTRLRELFGTFSRENGLELLSSCFTKIKKSDYDNSLVFPENAVDYAILYLRLKRGLLFREAIDNDPTREKAVEECLYRRIKDFALMNGLFTLTKDDAVFICIK